LSDYLDSPTVPIDIASHSALELMLAHYILSSHSLPASALTSFAEDTANSFVQKKLQSPDEYASIPLLLHRLGLISVFPQPSALSQADIGGGALELLLASDEHLRHICFRISGASLFGREVICGSRETLRDLALVLPSIMLQQLRIYNLELGTALLRSLNYLKIDQIMALTSGIRFVEAQQRNDGAFGFFAINSKDTGTGDNEGTVHRLYLLTTVNCLWAFAEICIPDFRLI